MIWYTGHMANVPAQPIRGNNVVHVILLDQSEASIQVMWPVLTNQRPVFRSCDLYRPIRARYHLDDALVTGHVVREPHHHPHRPPQLLPHPQLSLPGRASLKSGQCFKPLRILWTCFEKQVLNALTALKMSWKNLKSLMKPERQADKHLVESLIISP